VELRRLHAVQLSLGLEAEWLRRRSCHELEMGLSRLRGPRGEPVCERVIRTPGSYVCPREDRAVRGRRGFDTTIACWRCPRAAW
jgi:hypothetical protein